ncbi:hypothetical protein Q5752_002897 [Cryptotrichosporon argae]
MVLDVPRHVSAAQVSQVIGVAVTFFDPREAVKVHERLHSHTVQFEQDGLMVALHCVKTERSVVLPTAGHGSEWNAIWDYSESALVIDIVGASGVTVDGMQKCLTTIGELQAFKAHGDDGKVVPGEFDFVYLRFDFNNHCNVGYAFVNFTNVGALYRFIQARVGKKWNMFSSEKVLQVSYANIQNSAVMDVIEEWRPQIFYSSGALKGKPEPFPEPDNIAQRQRSLTSRLNSVASSSRYDESPSYDYNYAGSMFDSSYGF